MILPPAGGIRRKDFRDRGRFGFLGFTEPKAAPVSVIVSTVDRTAILLKLANHPVSE